MLNLTRIARRSASLAKSEIRAELRQIGSPRKMRGYDKLHLGAGTRVMEGWLNLDLEGDSIPWDLTRPLPLAPSSIAVAYSEHFIEHIIRPDALAMLKNCHRVMQNGATIRISTPDLKALVNDYQAGKLVEMPHGNWFPKTLCEMVNEGMRSWGHQYIYDEAELANLLREAGFVYARRMRRGQSDVAELRNLETRPDFEDLIMEATKTL